MKYWRMLIFIAGCLMVSSFISSVNSRLISNNNNINRIISKRNTDNTINKLPMNSDVGNDIVAENASPPPQKASSGQASISTSTFNLAKSIIGAGVLSLPSGIAAVADEVSVLLPASILCAVFGLVSAYSFSVIGKVCNDSKSSSFQEAWEKIVNKKSGWMISATITALCFLASLTYSIIIGDTFSAIFQTFNLPAIISGRTNTILLLSSIVLLPMCLLRSLTALAPFSILGLGGTLFTAVVMFLRLMDGSYAAGGRFFEAIPAKPSFKARGGYSLTSAPVFVLLSMLSTSFVAHYNAPAFFNELKDATMPKFNQVVTGGFASSILTFIFVMSVGFLTFGGNSAGFVLNNYANSDALATLSRVAIGLAILTGYPFVFSAMRSGILDLMGLKGKERDAATTPVTLTGLTLLTGLALVLTDVGFVVSIAGAMFGSSLMFVIPMIMNIANIKNNNKSMGKVLSKNNKLEIIANYGLIVSGIIMAIIGVAVSVLKQMGKM